MILDRSAAIGGGSVVRRADPLNREAPGSALIRGMVTPNAHFYVRSHFAVPALDGERWRLQVTGLVRRPLLLSLRDLLNLSARSMTVTVECAGNGRAFLAPVVGGE